LRREQGDRRPAPVSVAVLADPVFGANDPRVSSGHSSSPTDLHRSSQGPGRLPPLPSSGAEAKDILALSPPGRTLAALGFAASRETVLSGALSRYRILHFATHGHLDTEHPELSGIELSRVDERGRPREGFLGAHEIYRLRLEADLVVLSACDTALGREVRGEGLVGLTRGFFHAGARRVVVSLWPVQDQPTAELMRRFYQAMLRDHLPPAAALRTAQAGLRGEPRWRDPHDWAGFVLQGDWK
jgi:CHAT domain-containing protein